MTWQWFPVLPPAIIVLFALALIAVLAYGSWLLLQKHIPSRAVWQLGLLRLGMIALVTLSLFQPVLSVPRSVTDSAGLLVLLDASASMATPAANGTRWDEARQLAVQSPAVQSAGKSQTLHWFTFDRRAVPLTVTELDRVSASGEGTDVAGSLKSAWNHVRLEHASREIAAVPNRVLLISDGLNRGSADVVATAKELGLAVDILPLAASTPEQATSPASIELVQAARRVLVGSETAFQVTVRPDRSLDKLLLVVEEDGQELQRQELPSLVAAEDRFVVLKTRPKEAGLKRFTFRLLQGDAPVGEPFAVNVQAVDDRHDVLILEDTWRWEFKYLRRVLEDDPSFNLTAFLSRGGNAFVQFGEPDRRVKLGGFPQSRSELDGFDTIVVGDVQPTTWPRGLARHIHASVSEGGKSLVVMVGKHLGEWVETPELTQLLPVELTRDSGLPIAGPIEVRLTPAGRASTWFALPTGQTRETQTVSTLPTLEQLYPVLRKRPAATVLVEAVGQQNAYGTLPVIVEHTVGRGRVLFVATDTLWKWQTKGPRTEDGVTLHAAFWQHALRALAPAEQTAATRQLFLRPERTQYHVGSAVRIGIEQSSLGNEDTPSFELEATVVLPDGRRIPAAVQHRPDGLSSAPVVEFEATQAGRYRVEALSRSEGKTLAESSVVFEVASRGQEADGSPVDLATLQRWASATGGRIVDPAAADGWVSGDVAPSVTSVRRQPFDLWHNFSLLLLLCLLLAADWSLRLFRGFV